MEDMSCPQTSSRFTPPMSSPDGARIVSGHVGCPFDGRRFYTFTSCFSLYPASLRERKKSFSSHISIPRLRALSYLPPGLSPATTISVFVLTPPVTSAPYVRASSSACVRDMEVSSPVKTIFLPEKEAFVASTFSPKEGEETTDRKSVV